MAEFLTVHEAAQRVGLNPKTLERQLRDGRVPACCFAQDRPHTPYRVNAEAVRFFGHGSRWPEHRRELSQFIRTTPAPELEAKVDQLTAQVAWLAKHQGVEPAELPCG